MSDNPKLQISIVAGVRESFSWENISRSMNNIEPGATISHLNADGQDDIDDLLMNSHVILVGHGSLVLESIKRKLTRNSITFVNPEITEALKDKLYLLQCRTLVVSCKGGGIFDSKSTSFHDLISGSTMKIVKNCDEKDMSSKADSISRLILNFIKEEI